MLNQTPAGATPRTKSSRRFSLTSAIALIGAGCLLPSLAAAQEAAPEPVETTGEVVVTGSRVVRDGNSAPTPVTVVSAEQLQTVSPTSVADGLNLLPQFANSARPANAGPAAGGTNGANMLNLRGLGVSRTLVLIDGRRGAPSNNTSSTDLNLIPTSVIERVDVVTGGASAAYGSDAIAGVVNFVLDTDYEGLKGSFAAGISGHDDDESLKASLTWGGRVGNRGHLIAAIDYYDRAGFDYPNGRDWAEAGWGLISNPNAPPTSLIVPDARYAVGDYGGLITGPTALAGQRFLPGGVVDPFVYGTSRSANHMVGGDGPKEIAGLPAALEYLTLFTHFTYDLSDNLTVFAEAGFTESRTNYVSTNVNLSANNAFTIFANNAYLPAAIRTQMGTTIPSFTMGRINRDFGRPYFDNLNDSLNFTVGFNGKLGDWSYDGYYSRGENRFKILTLNNVNYRNVYDAADAVLDTGSGQIVCRSTLLGANNGCVPINLFGEGSPSAAAIRYVTGTSWSRQLVTQDAAGLNLAGDPFSLWAGPVSVGAGVEFRKLSSELVSDPISQSFVSAVPGSRGLPTALNGALGGWNLTNPQPAKGEYDIREAYVEALVPLAADLPFIEKLELNTAYRIADYSTSGEANAWKVGLSYSPFSDLRFRGTRSRDIRAANFGELYSGARQSQAFVRDPQAGNTQVRYTGRTLGNPNLLPEEADTTTLGFVYQPSWLEGFSMAVDAYDIQIDNAVAVLTAQEIVDSCQAGVAAQCALITRDSSNVLIAINTPFQNVASLSTKGIDYEFSYRRALGAGDFSARLLISNVRSLETKVGGAAIIDRAGDLGQRFAGQPGVPDWSGTLSIGYKTETWSVNFQERYIGDAVFDSTLAANAINDNTIPATWYSDATLTYKFAALGAENEAFFTVNNIFDQDPQIAPGLTTATFYPTNTSIYDMVGRYFTAGVRFEF